MRKIGLAVALLVHALLLHILLAWHLPSAKPGDVARETTVYLVTAPPPPPATPQATQPTSKPRPAARTVRSDAPPVRAVPEPAAITLTPPSTPDSADTKPGASLLESARKLAGGIDQQLRKEKETREQVVKPEIDLSERFKEVYNDYSAVPHHASTVSGDRLDRVEGPHGTYCVRTTGNGPGGGRDPFKDAGKQVVVNCPARGPLSDAFAQQKKKKHGQ